MPHGSAGKRRAGVVLLTLALAVPPITGCAKNDEEPAVATAEKRPSAAASPANPRDAALRYVRCMRDAGVAMDDPKPDGQFTYPRAAKGDGKFQEAYEKCRPLLPPGGGQAAPAPLTAEQLAQMRAYAKCMRENGLPDFRDPTAQGFTDDGGPQSGTPAFDKAYRKCVHLVQPQADPEATGVG
jgi:hypothetical protein